MNQTQSKKLLICYHSGARGDFLASILAGDKLKMCYTNPWVTHPNADFIKIHNPAPEHTYFPIGNVSVDQFVFDEQTRLSFNTLKIETDCYDSQLECALLKLSKDQRLNPINILRHIHMGQEHNNAVKKYNHLFDYSVNYKSLWDIDYIDNLYFEFNNHRLTSDDKERIKQNILINQQMIKDAKIKIGQEEFKKIYNHLFNGVPYS